MRLLKLLLLSLSFILSACSSIVNVDYASGTDFTHYKTFTIQDKPVRVAKDTRLNSPFMQQRVVQGLEDALTAKGFNKGTASADLQVKYFLDIKQEWEARDSGVSVGVGTATGNSGFAFLYSQPTNDSGSYDKLMLTIDLVSTATNKLVWRGSLAYRLSNGNNPETYTELVNEMVVEILKNFPPGSKN